MFGTETKTVADLLAPKKNVGFRVDKFPDFEHEKGLRAEAKGITPAAQGRPVWEPSDPRWALSPPYGFISFALRFGGPCVYCAEPIAAGSRELYSRKLNGVAHSACHANFDKPVPPGGVEPSKNLTVGWWNEPKAK
jgi:hypothetical protein